MRTGDLIVASNWLIHGSYRTPQGEVLFKQSFRGFLQLSHGVGIVVLCVLAWFASELSPLVLSILTTAILIVVAVWESLSLQSDPAEKRL